MNPGQRMVVAVSLAAVAAVLFFSVGRGGGVWSWGPGATPLKLFGLAVPVLLLGAAAYVLVSAPPRDRS